MGEQTLVCSDIRYVQKEMQHSAGIPHCRERKGVASLPFLPSIPSLSSYPFRAIPPFRLRRYVRKPFRPSTPTHSALFRIFHPLRNVRTSSKALVYFPTLALVGSVVMVHSRKRPRLTMYARERIQQMLSEGSTCHEVATALSQEGIHTCRQTVWRLERHIKAHGSVLPLPKSGRPTKLTNTALKKIDDAMSQDDETTAKELVAALQRAGVSMSKSTALKGRRLLGWISRGLPIVNSSVYQTVRRDFAGHRNILGKILMMSSGLMKRPYRWRLIEGFVVANVDKNRGTNPVLNIRQRYTCGLESVGMEQLKPVFLRVL